MKMLSSLMVVLIVMSTTCSFASSQLNNETTVVSKQDDIRAGKAFVETCPKKYLTYIDLKEGGPGAYCECPTKNITYIDKAEGGPGFYCEDKTHSQKDVVARGGSGDAGGGLAVGNELLDFVEATKGSAGTYIDIVKHKCFAYLNWPLSNRELVSSVTSEEILSRIEKRRWYTVNVLKEIENEDIHILTLPIHGKPTQVAVQSKSRKEIKILKSFFEAANCPNLAGLFAHEAFMSIALDYQLDRDSVRELTRHLFSTSIKGSTVSAEVLDKLMKDTKFSDHMQSKLLLLKVGEALRTFLALEDRYKANIDSDPASAGSHYVAGKVASDLLLAAHKAAYNVTERLRDSKALNRPKPLIRDIFDYQIAFDEFIKARTERNDFNAAFALGQLFENTRNIKKGFEFYD